MDRSRSPVLAVTVLVVVVGCVLAFSSGQFAVTSLWDIQWMLVRWGSSVHLSVAAVLLVGGVCFAQTRSQRILGLTLFFAVLSGAVSAWIAFHPSSLSDSAGTWDNDALRVLNYFSRTSTAVPAIVLLSLRLRGRFEWLRLGCLILMGGLLASECLVIYSTRITWLYRTGVVLETVLLTAEIGALAAVSWAVAFRQRPVSRPQVHAGGQMGISCPRCGLTQEVTLPEGECAGCRLRIHVALEEGA